MIIQSIVEDFYRKLVPGKTVLILSGLDVDSLCALRSLQSLLQNDYIPYTLKPIKSKHHLLSTISENKVIEFKGLLRIYCFLTTLFQSKTDQFILVNLGATVDFLNIDDQGNPIEEEDQNPLINDNDQIEIYIIDSHRPVNLVKYGSYLICCTTNIV